jgi:hypothetical protein
MVETVRMVDRVELREVAKLKKARSIASKT